MKRIAVASLIALAIAGVAVALAATRYHGYRSVVGVYRDRISFPVYRQVLRQIASLPETNDLCRSVIAIRPGESDGYLEAVTQDPKGEGGQVFVMAVVSGACHIVAIEHWMSI